MTLAGPDFTTTVPLVLAQPPSPVPGPQDPGGRGEDFGKSSPFGFLILILFFIAVIFLIRSMNKHLKRVPASFDPPDEETGEDTKPEAPKPNGNPEPA